MEENQIVSICFTLLGCIVSVCSLVNAYNAYKISQGLLEVNVHNMIYQTKKDVMQISLAIAEKGNENLMFTEVLNSAIESNLNAYEEACAKYLDKKVDKKRFKRNYCVEIRQLVENKNYKNYFDANASSYKCILKVYKEWNNLED